MLGRYEKAIELHEQALAINRETKIRNDERITLGNLGYVWRLRGRADLATTYDEQRCRSLVN
jgi:tetratricopeptide (TPR) repeat protein